MVEGWLQNVWNALGVASPLAAMFVFLFLVKAWRDEERHRAERDAIEKTKDDLHERTLSGLFEAAKQAERLASSVNSLADVVREAIRERSR